MRWVGTKYDENGRTVEYRAYRDTSGVAIRRLIDDRPFWPFYLHGDSIPDDLGGYFQTFKDAVTAAEDAINRKHNDAANQDDPNAPDPRKSTTMRLPLSLVRALDRESRAQGANSRTALTEAILTKYLRSRGHKHLKQRTLL